MKNAITGLRIRERREALKMSQTELAKITGYSDKTAISKIENCHSDLTQSKILTFAKALHTSHQYLMGWTDNPEEFPDDKSVKIFRLVRSLPDDKKDKVILYINKIKK